VTGSHIGSETFTAELDVGLALTNAATRLFPFSTSDLELARRVLSLFDPVRSSHHWKAI